MKLNVLGFGIAREIFGASEITLELPVAATVAELKFFLEEKYPRLKKLASYMVAVNDVYAQSEQVLSASEEIAIIPPVSGG
jgi:molybdopterin converting factor subunit 1